MSVQNKASLKSYFKRGLYPTAEQFASLIDSYYHKEEGNIPINAVDELPNRLNAKYDLSDGRALEQKVENNRKNLDIHKSDAEYEFLQLRQKDTTLSESLITAQNDVSSIREMLKEGATLTEAKAALLSLGSGYKDMHAIASTLKTFLQSKDVADATINTWQEIENFLQGITDTQNLTSLLNELENRITEAYLAAIANTANPKIAARYWNETNSTPVAAGYYGDLDALRELPTKLGLGRYLVTDDRVRRKLDPDNSNFYKDGTPAKLDGSEGQCMWCWNEHYYTTWQDGNNTIEAITFAPIPGKKSIHIPAGGISWFCGGVVDRVENKLCSIISNDERYRGGKGEPILDDYIIPRELPQKSQLGMPATNLSIIDFSNYARKRGEGWEANWYVARAVVAYTMRIILGTRCAQSTSSGYPTIDENGLYQGGIGVGVRGIDMWSSYNGYQPLIPTSVGVEKGDATGLVRYTLINVFRPGDQTSDIPLFFGLVNPFGHINMLVGGMLIDVNDTNSTAYVAKSMYAPINYNITADKIIAANIVRTNGYIKNLTMNHLCCLPIEMGGTSGTYFSDYASCLPSSYLGLRACAAGGASAYSGLHYINIFVANTGASSQTTAPLCFFEQDPIIS